MSRHPRRELLHRASRIGAATAGLALLAGCGIGVGVSQAPSAPAAPGRPGAADGDHDDPTGPGPDDLPGAAVRGGGSAPKRGLHRCPVRQEGRYEGDRGGAGVRRGRREHALRRPAGAADRRRRPDHDPGGRSRRLLRAVRQRPDSGGSRPEGQEASASASWARVSTCSCPACSPTSASTRAPTSTSSSSRPTSGRRCWPTGAVDAYLAFPPDRQELRAKQIGRLVVDSTVDRPWSQYFCCMIAGNSAFVQKNPVATKRAVRAILKAADFCSREPAQAARSLVDGGYTPNYDYALEALTDIPYGQWREYDAEDTVRFYSLRLQEAGMSKSTPDQILQRGHRLALLQRAEAGAEGVARAAANGGGSADVRGAVPTSTTDDRKIMRSRRRRAAPARAMAGTRACP